MIMGLTALVVPDLHRIPTERLGQLWISFILINTGCTLRVTLQMLTDFQTTAFAMVGLSGLLEVAALTVWGFHLTRQMFARPG